MRRSFLLAVVGDLVGSRAMSRQERHDAQLRLKGVLQEINLALDARLVCRARITVGDEFEMLLEDPEGLIPALTWLSGRLHPTRLRVGLGRGAVFTVPARDAVQEADGPAFHQARSALEHAASQGYSAAVRGFADADGPLTALLAASGLTRSGWTTRMNEIVGTLRSIDSSRPVKSQKAVAAELGVTPATISTALKSANFAILQRLEQETDRLLLARWGSWKRFEAHVDRLEGSLHRLKGNHASNIEADEELADVLRKVGSPQAPKQPDLPKEFANAVADMLMASRAEADDALLRLVSMTERILSPCRDLLDARSEAKAELFEQRLQDLEKTVRDLSDHLMSVSQVPGYDALKRALGQQRAHREETWAWIGDLPRGSYGRRLVVKADELAEVVGALAV